MALRSLGTTLLAKAGAGSALRKNDEDRTGGAVPQANASAQSSSVARSSIDQPLELATPGGTEKQIAVKPNLQPNMSTAPATQPMGMGNQGLVPQMGGAAAAASAGRNINAPAPAPMPGNNNVGSPSIGTPSLGKPILSPSGLRTSSSVSGVGGKATAAVKNMPMLESILPAADIGSKAPPSTYNADQAQTLMANRDGGLLGNFGGRVIADEPNPDKNVYAEHNEKVANLVNSPVAQGALKSLSNYQPTPTPTQQRPTTPVSSPPKKTYVAPKPAPAPTPPKPTPTPIRSQASSNNNNNNSGQNIIQKVTSFLRSLFKR